MSSKPIERVALDAIEFIEDLTADPLLDSEDVEMRLEDVQAHAGIEAASLRKRLAAALEAEASEGERRGLERAAKVADDHAKAWGAAQSTPAIVIAEAIRALIPEALAREGE